MRRPYPGATGDVAYACRSCPLWRGATQTVFGKGPRDADVMLLGEQPGDAEDRAGEPFVGPAGQLLDQALVEAGIDRTRVYGTNAVKHFKWEPRGKRRIHKTPSSRDIAAYRPWLESEVRLVRPEILVCLGSTAATAVLAGACALCAIADNFAGHSSPSEHLLRFIHPLFSAIQTRLPAKRTTNSFWPTFDWSPPGLHIQFRLRPSRKRYIVISACPTLFIPLCLDDGAGINAPVPFCRHSVA